MESISKAVALLVLLMYVCGFLVVSLHHASYGFLETSPLKPRILTAGLLFLSFCLLPAISARRIFNYKEVLSPDQRLARCFLAAFAYLVGCIVLSNLISTIYARVPLIELNHETNWKNKNIYILISTALSILAIIGFSIKWAWKNYKNKPKKVSWVVATMLALWILIIVSSANTTITSAVQLWLFAIGIFYVVTDYFIKSSEKPNIDWEIYLIPFVAAALSVFPAYIYPKIKSSWGGGAPLPITIYFESNSEILPGSVLAADMLDESDEGYFIVRKNETKALYIPRSQVAAIYFSDEPLDPKLLGRKK